MLRMRGWDLPRLRWPREIRFPSFLSNIAVYLSYAVDEGDINLNLDGVGGGVVFCQ